MLRHLAPHYNVALQRDGSLDDNPDDRSGDTFDGELVNARMAVLQAVLRARRRWSRFCAWVALAASRGGAAVRAFRGLIPVLCKSMQARGRLPVREPLNNTSHDDASRPQYHAMSTTLCAQGPSVYW